MNDIDDKTYLLNFYTLDSDVKQLSYGLILHLDLDLGIKVEEAREKLQLLRDRSLDVLPLHIVEKYSMQWKYDKLTVFLAKLDEYLEDSNMIRELHEDYRISHEPIRPASRSWMCNLL